MIVRRLSTRIFNNQHSLSIPSSLFCTAGNEFQAVRFKKGGILDLKNLSYRPQKPLVYENGKCLIYSNKKKWYTTPLLYSHLNAIGLYLLILIKKNPFYLTFPAALPLMFIAEAFVLRRIFLKQVRYRPIVGEIYIWEGGEMVEIVYANKITRKLKDLPMRHMYHVSSMITPTPSDREDGMTGWPFPEKLEDFDKPAPLFQYAWKKYYTNVEMHFMIPMRYDYCNKEILVEIMKGKFIDNGPPS